VLQAAQAFRPQIERAEKAKPSRDQILALYDECKGYLVCVQAKLVARQLVMLSYAPLTAFCRRIRHRPRAGQAGVGAYAH